MKQNIYIGKSNWIMDTPFEMEWDAIGSLFTVPSSDSLADTGKVFRVIPTDVMPDSVGNMVAETMIRRIFRAEYSDHSDGSGLEQRQYLIPGIKEVYAFYEELDREHALIYLDKRVPELFEANSFFYNYLAPERNLIADDQMILHSCFLIHQGEAILFTAPSGTGKSTQGALWEQFRGAVVVNGDRSLLAKTDGRWKAYGMPFSGTSGICRNAVVPVKAIVYLHQYPENAVHLLPPGIAFRRLYDQITVNDWNRDFVLKVCDMLEDLVSSVPVYDFYCTKYADAVDCLESAIYGD